MEDTFLLCLHVALLVGVCRLELFLEGAKLLTALD
jgi:hypothetical protein